MSGGKPKGFIYLKLIKAMLTKKSIEQYCADNGVEIDWRYDTRRAVETIKLRCNGLKFDMEIAGAVNLEMVMERVKSFVIHRNDLEMSKKPAN